MEPIFHIADGAAWRDALAAGEYRCSTLGKTLEEVGFIHCSRREQVAGVANALYHGQSGLVLLTIDRAKVRAGVRDEDLVGAGDVCPHVYGPLNPDAVERVIAYAPGPDGRFAPPA
jgi:uncharacterized protein (DUF952 family)